MDNNKTALGFRRRMRDNMIDVGPEHPRMRWMLAPYRQAPPITREMEDAASALVSDMAACLALIAELES